MPTAAVAWASKLALQKGLASILEVMKSRVAVVEILKQPGASTTVQTARVAKARAVGEGAVPTVDEWDQNPAALAAVPPKDGSPSGVRATLETPVRAH